MNLIISGPQGSGKGTQAELLAEKLGLFHMGSGKMFREMAEDNQRIRKMIDDGILVPDEETIGYMEKHIEASGGSFNKIIFDGFPRTIKQYQVLKDWLSKKGEKIDFAIYLEVSEPEVIERLSARRTCKKCGRVYNLITNPPPTEDRCECGGELEMRDDDNSSAIKKRLNLFQEKTLPLLKEYEKDGILIKIDGERPIEDIYEDTLKRLGAKDGDK